MRTSAARQLEGVRRGRERRCPSTQYSGWATLRSHHERRRPSCRSPATRSPPRARASPATCAARRSCASPGSELGIDCAELWLKLEQLQVGGSFKARGMFNRMRSNPLPEAGVVIASGGNAGIAVAVAAQALGVRCEVFVPESSSPAKRAKLAELGAVLTVVGASYADALAASLARQATTGALLMHAYDQREVVIGAGTLAAEVEDEAGRARSRAGQRRRRRADRRHRRLVPGRLLDRRARARAGADPVPGARGRPAGRRRRSAASPPIRSARAASARSPGT